VSQLVTSKGKVGLTGGELNNREGWSKSQDGIEQRLACRGHHRGKVPGRETDVLAEKPSKKPKDKCIRGISPKENIARELQQRPEP